MNRVNKINHDSIDHEEIPDDPYPVLNRVNSMNHDCIGQSMDDDNSDYNFIKSEANMVNIGREPATAEKFHGENEELKKLT